MNRRFCIHLHAELCHVFRYILFQTKIRTTVAYNFKNRTVNLLLTLNLQWIFFVHFFFLLVNILSIGIYVLACKTICL